MLVNNAGRSQRAWILDTPLQIDRELINLNVVGQVSLTKCVLPHMVSRRHGYILVNSSVLGKMRKLPFCQPAAHRRPTSHAESNAFLTSFFPLED